MNKPERCRRFVQSTRAAVIPEIATAPAPRASTVRRDTIESASACAYAVFIMLAVALRKRHLCRLKLAHAREVPVTSIRQAAGKDPSVTQFKRASRD
jgi:hypothetical protein